MSFSGPSYIVSLGTVSLGTVSFGGVSLGGISLGRVSLGREAAVDRQRLAGDIGAGVGCKKDDRAMEILQLAIAADRGLGRVAPRALGIGEDRRGQRRRKEAGRDRVAADAFFG